MSLHLKIIYRDGTEYEDTYCLCLAILRTISKTKINNMKYFEVSSIKSLTDVDKRYHKLLMDSFIKNYLAPGRPLVARFYPKDSWALIFLITSAIRISWEFRDLMRNILKWYETGGCSADEALILGNIIQCEEIPKFQADIANNHGYVDQNTPIKGLVSRSKNLLTIIKDEPGINERMIDFKNRMNAVRCNGKGSKITIQSVRKMNGYRITNELNYSLEEVRELINVPTTIEQEYA